MSQTRKRARQLRRDGTDAERLFWSKVRDRQLHNAKFRRQHPIGPYVADFVCLRHRLVIELDGGQHNSDPTKEAERTRFIEAEGFRVLRFWNNEALENLDGVLEAIALALERDTPSP